MKAGTASAVGLTLMGGSGIATTIAIVGRFGVQIGVLPALLFTSTVGAIVTIVALAFVPRGLDRFVSGFRVPAWMWAAGLLGTLFGFCIITAGPRIGITTTIALAISGQIIVGVIIDRFGTFGIRRISLTRPRILAIGLLICGAVLTLQR